LTLGALDLAPRYFVSTDVYDDDAELALDAADVALDEAAVADVDCQLPGRTY
jgi:hypothetical protein